MDIPLGIFIGLISMTHFRLFLDVQVILFVLNISCNTLNVCGILFLYGFAIHT